MLSVSAFGVHRSQYQVVRQASPTKVPVTAAADPSFTAVSECHMHGSSVYCIGPDGEDVEVLVDGTEGSATPAPTTEDKPDERHCHFHAGVEHCVGGGSDSHESKRSCSRTDRDYNIPVRIGLLFAILVTSFVGVVIPIVLDPLLPARFGIIFVALKQFGTGVIISTAFVHLFTHSYLMFTNECLSLEYEGITAAIVMAGIFLSFAVDYVSHRLSKMAATTWGPGASYNGDFVTVMVLEAGIIFHSLLIGLALVVAGDSFFITLSIVIIFYQMFEGIALGSRIASIGRAMPRHGHHHHLTPSSEININSDSSGRFSILKATDEPTTTTARMMMALAFALVTPVGMAIGIGVLHRFNRNDPSTLIALGTLDALSAGILVWVGIVEMWARDWMYDGELVEAGAVVTWLAGFGLVAGMALMSFLGKWA
ncbi:ZIP zinc transporter [Chaetomium strumarium]|uniref:ZIP zinc transporter n=1 Tax=Chaetomium strumarium TaxID=1170767 RepID=A0AAJ0M053_9PEZI|nr:ZIP zinc transporter [Chaetomium strumarium]